MGLVLLIAFAIYAAIAYALCYFLLPPRKIPKLHASVFILLVLAPQIYLCAVSYMDWRDFRTSCKTLWDQPIVKIGEHDGVIEGVPMQGDWIIEHFDETYAEFGGAYEWFRWVDKDAATCQLIHEPGEFRQIYRPPHGCLVMQRMAESPAEWILNTTSLNKSLRRWTTVTEGNTTLSSRDGKHQATWTTRYHLRRPLNLAVLFPADLESDPPCTTAGVSKAEWIKQVLPRQTTLQSGY